MEKNIRLATYADVEDIKKIYAEARAFMIKNGNNAQWINGYPESTIDDDIKKDGLFICEIRDNDKDAWRPAACYTLFYGETDPTYVYIEGSWKNDLPYAVVHRMGVADFARCLGLATYCMDEVFKKYGNIRVDTHAKNIPMQKFLKKNGFEPCGTVYMADKSPRIAYQKTS